MAKVNLPSDAGSSPRKLFLADFNAAFAQGDAEIIIQYVAENIRWTIHGDQELNGKADFAAEVRKMANDPADAMTIHTIIADGETASLNGEIVSGNKHYAFCDVYRFRDATGSEIVAMDSYVMEVAR